jgi:hypothetical protein
VANLISVSTLDTNADLVLATFDATASKLGMPRPSDSSKKPHPPLFLQEEKKKKSCLNLIFALIVIIGSYYGCFDISDVSAGYEVSQIAMSPAICTAGCSGYLYLNFPISSAFLFSPAYSPPSF